MKKFVFYFELFKTKKKWHCLAKNKQEAEQQFNQIILNEIIIDKVLEDKIDTSLIDDFKKIINNFKNIF